jgi:hypothetical protein
MELDLESLFGLNVHTAQMYSLAETPQPQPPSLPPAFGLIYVGAIGQLKTTSLCDTLQLKLRHPPVSLEISGINNICLCTFSISLPNSFWGIKKKAPKWCYRARTWGLKCLGALYRKSALCIPRNETPRPRSQFLVSRICQRFICRIGLPAK